MRKAFTFIAGLCSLAASAGIVNPEAALEAARAEMRAVSSARPRAAAALPTMTLTETVCSADGTPTLYLFTGADGGFMLTSADDCAAAMLLGYSDDAPTESIPDALEEWMQGLGSEIHYARTHGADGAAAAVTPIASTGYKSAIEPMCSTRWGQGNPYNQLCPTVGGGRALTGCVATAMAQVMKVHVWPVTGTGTHTYSFSAGGTRYTDSFDFGATTFDWDNMLDSYGGNTVQREAVATLMHACGVACDMMYSPSSSGSYGTVAGMGMIKHLGYDPSMTLQQRNWYTASDWNALVYNELAAGRPMYYQGYGTGGHAFVCDGYSSNDYFHFNWGWTGSYDGYFLLSALSPGSYAFNNNQAILLGCRPRRADTPADARTPVNMACEGALGASVYTPELVALTCTGGYGGFFSWTLDTINATLGMRLALPDGDVYVESTYTDIYPPQYGEYDIRVETAKLPVGTYQVFPAVRDNADSTWYDMHTYASSGTRSMLFTVTADTVIVGPGSYGDALCADYNNSEAKGYNGNGYFTGQRYEFSYTLTAGTSLEGQSIVLALVDPSDSTVMCITDAQAINFSDLGGRKTYIFSMTMPDYEEADPGTYALLPALVDTDGDVQFIDYIKYITLQRCPLIVKASLTAVESGDTADEPVLIRGRENRCTLIVNVNEPWTADVRCHLYKKHVVRYNSVMNTDYTPVSLAKGDTPLTFTLDIPADLALGRYFVGLVYKDSVGTVTQLTPTQIYLEEPTGIENVWSGAAPSRPDAPYYNLQGIPVASPRPGQVYLHDGRLIKYQ